MGETEPQFLEPENEPLPVASPETETELKDMLRQYGVWSENWTNEKVAELLLEIKAHEKKLVEYYDPDDKDHLHPYLGADMKIVSVDVLHKLPNGQTEKLKEQFQTSLYIYSGGNVEAKTRTRDKKRAISGKIKGDEDPDGEAIRELFEEISLKEGTTLTPVETVREAGVSKGYPGLKTYTTVYGYETYINDADYAPHYANTEKKIGKEDVTMFAIDVFGWETPTQALCP